MASELQCGPGSLGDIHQGISRSQTARGPHLLRPFCVDNYEYRLTSLTLYIVFEISFLSGCPGIPGARAKRLTGGFFLVIHGY